MRFDKYTINGNDILLLPWCAKKHQAETARRICNRHFGLGADGCIFYNKKQEQYYNQDGTTASLCANGFAALLCARYQKDSSTYLTAANVQFRIKYRDPVVVNVRFGLPDVNHPELPERGRGHYTYTLEGQTLTLTTFFYGTIHTVLVTHAFTPLVLMQAEALSQDPFFPSGTNVNLVVIASRREIHLKTYERGCGFTAACGTGIASTLYALFDQGRIDNEVTVNLSAGKIKATVNPDGVEFSLTPTLIARGQYGA